ncbi:Innexin family-containing protein [Aphelenchoides bicaudatus]|nr:Innexin family-containing protein [Aphelenchoides bicaudatus]
MMLEAFISMLRYLSSREDDDIADRLNYLYTPNMLLAFSVLISFKQFGGRPLECIFPSKFSSSLQEYAENFCWAESTYFVQPDVHVATIKEQDRYSPERKLSYYQWVPFFLLLQAACFRFPSFLWKCLSINSGLRIHEIVSRALDPGNMEEITRKRNLDILSKHISNALRFQRRISHRHIIIHKTFKFLNVTYSACFISTKTDKYHWYGFGVIRDVIRGVQWETSGFFPRVSICDFTVRQVANIQKYSVQCVLVINVFNEKIFILLWFWYTMLLVITLLSFVYWFLVMTFPCFGRWYIATNLELAENVDITKNKKDIRKFVNEYLKQDGIFVLRMVSMHAGILFGNELVYNLYSLFKEIREAATPAIPKTTENHYVSNHDQYLRRRKKDKKKRADDEDATAFITSALSKSPAPSISESSSSTDSDKDSKKQKSEKSLDV